MITIVIMAEEEQKKKNDQLLQVSQLQLDFPRDVLETIFSHLPLIHLLPASTVSKSWNSAVFSSLRRFNSPKPWLLLHTQRTRSPHATSAFAYDPRSNIWLQINQKSPPLHLSALRSSNSTLLYVLTPSRFSFSTDPFHLTWHHVKPPAVWRADPTVAVVGHHIIVAGGACDFEDDPLAVEIYDTKTGTWERSESMPATLKDSASSTWLSVADNTQTMFIMEQMSGVTHCFNPNSKMWSGPYDVRPDRSIFFSIIGFLGDSLIMVGLLGDAENVNDVKVWELNGESLEYCKEIGVMPKELVQKLKGDGTSLSCIKLVSCMGDILYVYNPEEGGELVVLEMGGEGRCEYGSLKNEAVSDGSRVAERVVLTCSKVGLGDLGRAVGTGNVTFTHQSRSC